MVLNLILGWFCAVFNCGFRVIFNQKAPQLATGHKNRLMFG
jgi:hypothetical protein